MAGETISMIKLKQIFLLRHNGVSLEVIARNVQSSRNTVKKYIRLAAQKGFTFQELITKEEHELEKIFADPVHTSKAAIRPLKNFFPGWKKNSGAPA